MLTPLPDGTGEARRAVDDCRCPELDEGDASGKFSDMEDPGTGRGLEENDAFRRFSMVDGMNCARWSLITMNICGNV